MTCSDVGMLNFIDINEDIKVDDGNFIKAINMGTKQVSVLQPCNIIKHFVSNDVEYVPKLLINLSSITPPFIIGGIYQIKGSSCLLTNGVSLLSYRLLWVQLLV
jgi:hypothetical protein